MLAQDVTTMVYEIDSATRNLRAVVEEKTAVRQIRATLTSWQQQTALQV